MGIDIVQEGLPPYRTDEYPKVVTNEIADKGICGGTNKGYNMVAEVGTMPQDKTARKVDSF